MESGWEDCMGVSVHFSGDAPGVWRTASFSPARARLLAEHLLLVADHIEREEPPSMHIDKEENKVAT